METKKIRLPIVAISHKIKPRFQFSFLDVEKIGIAHTESPEKLYRSLSVWSVKRKREMR